MIETTTTADALGPMPGERRKRRATERPYQREAFQLYLKLRSIKRVADAGEGGTGVECQVPLGGAGRRV